MAPGNAEPGLRRGTARSSLERGAGAPARAPMRPGSASGPGPRLVSGAPRPAADLLRRPAEHRALTPGVPSRLAGDDPPPDGRSMRGGLPASRGAHGGGSPRSRAAPQTTSVPRHPEACCRRAGRPPVLGCRPGRAVPSRAGHLGSPGRAPAREPTLPSATAATGRPGSRRLPEAGAPRLQRPASMPSRIRSGPISRGVLSSSFQACSVRARCPSPGDFSLYFCLLFA